MILQYFRHELQNSCGQSYFLLHTGRLSTKNPIKKDFSRKVVGSLWIYPFLYMISHCSRIRTELSEYILMLFCKTWLICTCSFRHVWSIFIIPIIRRILLCLMNTKSSQNVLNSYTFRRHSHTDDVHRQTIRLSLDWWARV